MFQLIYAWGMFQPGHILVLKRQVSIHICARNVSPMVTIRLIMPSFQIIYAYAWGMFLSITLEELLRFYECFNSYICGECFM